MERGLNLVTISPVHAMTIRKTLAVAGLPAFFAEAMGRLGTYIGTNGGEFTGPPFAAYHAVSDAAVDVEVAMPVARPLAAEGDIAPGEFPGGTAVEYVYFGPYDGMTSAYQEVYSWLAANGKSAAGPPREVYYSDPAVSPNPADWETHIVQPYE